MSYDRNKLNFKTILLYIFIISTATCPAVLIWQNTFNSLLLLLMLLSPMIVLFSLLKDFRLYRNEFFLLMFLLTIFFFPSLRYSESLRWSTILYSTMFCVMFMAYVRLQKHSRLTITQYLELLKFLIYAYFVVLLIQQFCVLTGLPIFLVYAYNPLEPWKLNSLNMEPSWSARMVPLLMYSFISIKEIMLNRKYSFKDDIKEDKHIWVAFIWTMVTMGSGTAFLFIPIMLLKFVRIKTLLPIFALIVFMFVVGKQMNISAIERTYNTFVATLTLDENKIIETDISAASRIVPMIVVSKNIGISTFDDWFGHGIDHSQKLLQGVFPGYPDNVVGGGMFQVWFEYGFISFILFTVFSFIICYNKNDLLSIVFWFMLVFMYGVNNQIVWITIILLYTNKLFIERNKHENCSYCTR